MTLPGIGTLWVGSAVSWLEQLCLKSFLDHGHPVTVFSYEKIDGLPDGVETADAGNILPADRILRHARTGSPAYHADIFRLQMLKQTDLIWADTDAYCCKPWNIDPGAPFYGWISDKVPQVNNGVLRLPKDSKTLAAMIEFAGDEFPIPPWFSDEDQAELKRRKTAGKGVHVSLLPWGVLGPDALTWFLKETGEIEAARPGHVIYPVPFKTAGMTLNPNRINQTRSLIKEDTLSIHFWGRRFRNIAAKHGGIPPAGCYVEELLAKHGIDPQPTAHMMRRVVPSKSSSRAEIPGTVDFSMFSVQDVANLVLQRSEVTESAAAVRAWTEGVDAPLLDLARAERDAIMHGVLEIARRQCEIFLDATDALQPKRIADIGCGYAFAALVLYHRYGCDLVLIDIEDGAHRHFGFETEGAGYSDLGQARRFLEANGVPPEKILTLNPRHEDLAMAGQLDLVISQISCGFHYPANTYDSFYRDQLADGGAVVLDIRKGSGGVPFLKKLGPIEILERQPKYSTVLARKELAGT